MSLFANIDENNKVVNVIVVSDSISEDASAEYLKKFGEGRWVRTSIDGGVRRSYAAVGATYLADRDVFLPPQHYESWVFSEEKWEWEPPVPMPASTGPWQWVEETKSWVNNDDR